MMLFEQNARRGVAASRLVEIANAASNFEVVDSMMARAMQDARQAEDLALRQEALTWLWVCCPDIAAQLDLPEPGAQPVTLEVVAYTARHALL